MPTTNQNYKKILSELHYSLMSIDIDKITYSDSVSEVPVADIVELDWKNILVTPPKNSSRQTFSEIQYIYESIKRQRTDAWTEKLLRIDYDPGVEIFDLFDSRKLNFPHQYLRMFYDITKPILLNIKQFYNRPRPETIANIYGIELPVIETETHHTPSYPSGHTFYTSLAANIGKSIYPSLSFEFDSIVKNTETARVLQGVHYPSDNLASINLSRILFNNLHPLLQKESQWTDFMRF
jgi:hypothetical protein